MHYTITCEFSLKKKTTPQILALIWFPVLCKEEIIRLVKTQINDALMFYLLLFSVNHNFVAISCYFYGIIMSTIAPQKQKEIMRIIMWSFLLEILNDCR